MTAAMISYAQNREDVVLWRALGHLQAGAYVDVGANHPVVDSVTNCFVQAGWSGVDVEPVPHYAALLRAARPQGDVVAAMVSDRGQQEETLYEVVGTGLSTSDSEIAENHSSAGFETREITVPVLTLGDIAARDAATDANGDTHFLKVDVEGDEAAVLRSADLTTWRPWVVVVEATRPTSTEASHQAWEPDVLAAGYRFCLFDGLSRFYVAEEHSELAPALSYPACPLDPFMRHEERQLLDRAERAEQRLETHAEEVELLRRSVLAWRDRALVAWAESGPETSPDPHLVHRVAELDREIVAVHRTVSWRVTAPLRAVRRLTSPAPR